MGALALGTEPPTPALLMRKPYKRSASLISRPMARNIVCQAIWQLTLLLVLLYAGAPLFGVRPISQANCFIWHDTVNGLRWDPNTQQVCINMFKCTSIYINAGGTIFHLLSRVRDVYPHLDIISSK
jgi:magnesium-transporting ATPase (P-type)